MKITTNIKALFGTFAIMLVTLMGNAQPSHPNSPHITATGASNGAKITITYGSPFVKGRAIWGGLIPYDKAWRAGADEATTFETDKDILVQGMKLPAGKYTFFATPGKNEWTLTFNSQVGQWGIKRTGEANFDPAKNVIVVKATPHADKTMHESLTYEVKSPGFVLSWEYLSIPVTIGAVSSM